MTEDTGSVVSFFSRDEWNSVVDVVRRLIEAGERFGSQPSDPTSSEQETELLTIVAEVFKSPDWNAGTQYAAIVLLTALLDLSGKQSGSHPSSVFEELLSEINVFGDT